MDRSLQSELAKMEDHGTADITCWQNIYLKKNENQLYVSFVVYHQCTLVEKISKRYVHFVVYRQHTLVEKISKRYVSFVVYRQRTLVEKSLRKIIGEKNLLEIDEDRVVKVSIVIP